MIWTDPPHGTFPKANWDCFSCCCSEEVREELTNGNIDNFKSNLVKTINTIAQNSIPICKSSAGCKIKVPWWNDECKQAIRAILKRVRKSLLIQDAMEFKRRAQAQRAIKEPRLLLGAPSVHPSTHKSLLKPSGEVEKSKVYELKQRWRENHLHARLRPSLWSAWTETSLWPWDFHFTYHIGDTNMDSAFKAFWP